MSTTRFVATRFVGNEIPLLCWTRENNNENGPLIFFLCACCPHYARHIFGIELFSAMMSGLQGQGAKRNTGNRQSLAIHIITDGLARRLDHLTLITVCLQCSGILCLTIFRLYFLPLLKLY